MWLGSLHDVWTRITQMFICMQINKFVLVQLQQTDVAANEQNWRKKKRFD